MSRNLLATTPVTSFDGTESIYVVKNGADGKATIADIANYRYIQQLQHDGYPNSDGATTNRASGIYGPFDATNNPREWIAGAASLTEAIVLTVPTANPASSAYLFRHTGTTTPGVPPTFVIYTLQADIRTDGSLYITQTASSGTFEYRDFYYAGFRAAYSGQTGLLKVYLVQGTTNPVVTWNGVNISSSFSLVTNGTTPPAWLDSNLVPTYRLVGYNWPSGPAPIVTPILGQTSAADDAFYLQTGKWPAWVVAGGTTTKFNTATFTVGSGTGTLSTNTSTSLVCAGAPTSLNAYSNASQVLISGQKIRANLTVSGVTGSQVFFTTDSVGSGYGGSFGSSIATLANGTADYDLTVTASGAFFGRFIFTSTTAASVTINSFDRIGALSIPAVQPINVLDDVSGIGGNQGRLLGCTPVTDKRSTRILGRINAASATNQQILGGAVLPVPLNHAIEFVDVECDGSVTLSLGDGTTATRYTASTALTAGRTRIALTTPFAADSAKTGLYVNVTVAGGTYAQFSILGHLLK